VGNGRTFIFHELLSTTPLALLVFLFLDGNLQNTVSPTAHFWVLLKIQRRLHGAGLLLFVEN
jgi:hypothetical protein